MSPLKSLNTGAASGRNLWASGMAWLETRRASRSHLPTHCMVAACKAQGCFALGLPLSAPLCHFSHPACACGSAFWRASYCPGLTVPVAACMWHFDRSCSLSSPGPAPVAPVVLCCKHRMLAATDMWLLGLWCVPATRRASSSLKR